MLPWRWIGTRYHVHNVCVQGQGYTHVGRMVGLDGKLCESYHENCIHIPVHIWSCLYVGVPKELLFDVLVCRNLLPSCTLP